MVKNSTFNGKSIFTWTGSTNNSWEGGNYFAAACRFTNNGTGHMTMQTNSADRFIDSLTINGGSGRFYMGIGQATVFDNNLYFTGSLVDFSQGSGTTTFTGSSSQLIKGNSTLAFKNLVIDKSNNDITLQAPITINNNLDLLHGKIISDTTNLLTFIHSSTWTHGSSSSFISGPVKKIGNAAFSFPVGKGGEFNPIGISAPTNSTDAFVAEYFNSSQAFGDSTVDSLKHIFECFYWKLKQTAGTSNVYVTLGWDTSFCAIFNKNNLRVTNWDGVRWIDLGHNNLTGNVNGTLSASITSAQLIYLTFGYTQFIITPTLDPFNRNIDHYYGINGKNIFRDNLHDWRFKNANLSDNTELIQKVQGLNPSVLRYNAGAPGNYFDWKNGYFFSDAHLYKYDQFLRDDFYGYNSNQQLFIPSTPQDYTYYDARLEKFKQALDFTGAVPLFELNISSSDIDYQLALLIEARRLNIPVKYVELGTELYLSGHGDENILAFTTGTDYGKKCYDWTRRIKETLGEDVKVAVCAANYDPAPRRRDWNKLLINELMKNEAGNHNGPDAIVFHQYIHNVVPFSGQKYPLTPADFNKMFRSAFKAITTTTKTTSGIYTYCIFDEEMEDIKNLYPNRDYEIWMTEYGLDERDWMVHGSWAAGLWTALQTMLYLENTNISQVTDFTLWSNSIWGEIFVNDDAFLNEKDETRHQFVFDNTNGNYKNSHHDQYSALGHAVKHVGKALKNAKFAQKINFGTTINIGQLQNKNGILVDIPALYGYYLSDENTSPPAHLQGKQLVFVNLSNTNNINIDLTNFTSVGNWTNYDITSIDSAGNFVLGYNGTDIECINGDGDIKNPLNDKPYQAITGNTILIPAYSIIRIYSCEIPPLTLAASAEYICQGQEVLLNLLTPVNENCTLSWSNGATTGSYNKVTPNYSGSNCNPSSSAYTITVTDATCGTNGSSATATKTIQVRPPVDVTVTNGTSQCPGASTSLTATPNNNPNCTFSSKFEWIDSEGDGMGYGVTITVSPQITTTYSVYALYDFTNPSMQCAAMGEVTQIVIPLPGLPADTIVCNKDKIDITLNQYGNGYTFLWNDGTTNSYLTNQYLQFTAFADGSSNLITVTVTSINPSCIVTDEMIVNNSECCKDATHADFNINATYNHDGQVLADDINANYMFNIASFDNTGLTLDFGSTGYQLPVNGKWTPDYAVKIIKGDLSMGEGALIDIQPHRIFQLRGTTLNACANKLWRGINVQPAGIINTDFQGSIRSSINDAEHAIIANNLSVANFIHTDFDKNYVSVYVPPMTQFSINSVESYNTANNFTSTANLLPGYTGQTIATGTHPYAGLVLNDMAFSIGVAGPNASSFEDLNNGIIGMNSSIYIENTTFTGMKFFDAYPMPLNGVPGTGIFSGADYGKHGLLFQKGLGITTPSATPDLTFNDCVRGIHTNNTSADISLNRMDEITNFGVLVENGRFATINVNSNQVKTYFIGMGFSNNKSANSFIVSGNDIGIGTLNLSTTIGQIGIMINEPAKTGLSKRFTYHILCNHISDNFFTGMQMIALPDVGLVKNNTVNMNDFTMPNSIGLDFLACAAMRINSNIAAGDDITIGSAYHFSLNDNPLISDNRSNGSRFGFDFEGGNTNTRFITNRIGFLDYGSPYHDVGFHIQDNTVIGQQYSTVGNTTTVYNNWWLADPNNNGSVYGTIDGGARNDNNANNSYQLSQFKVPDTSVPGDIDYPNNFCAGGGAWFKTVPSPVIPDHNYTDDCTIPQIVNDDEVTYLDRMTAKDSIFTGAFQPETRSILESDLMDKLNRNDSLRENDSLFAAFYSSMISTPLGQLSLVRLLINEIFNDDSDVLNEINSIDSLIKTLHTRKSIIDSSLHCEISESDSLGLIAESAQVLQAIASYLQRKNLLITQLNDARQSKIDTAMSLNNSISTSELIEENEQIENGIFLDKIIYGNSDLDSTQKANNELISIQCPFAGGRAVYLARVVRRMLGDTIVYNDSLACADSESRLSHHSKKENNFFIIVSPNPVTENCTFNYKLPEDKSGKIEIYTGLNEKVDELHLNSNSNKINYNLSHLKSGFYLFRLISDGENIGSGKIVIAK